MKQTKRRRAVNYLVGILIMLFVLIGIFSTVRFLGGKVHDLSSDAKQKETFRAMLAPVVMNDPNTFDDVSLADPGQLIAIAIWNILGSNPDPDRYDYYDGEMLLPKKEVEDSFHTLFGADSKIRHATVDGGGVSFRYSEKQNCYSIPITGINPIYTPQIEEVKSAGDQVVLTVGYLAGEDFTRDEKGNPIAPEPAKYMRVTLRRGADGALFISAIQNIYDE